MFYCLFIVFITQLFVYTPIESLKEMDLKEGDKVKVVVKAISVLLVKE